MGLLEYTSNEMFSSTELIRKNKNIFDKLNKKEIEKAIILRDGKPGIILMDFNHYEYIIREYLELKEANKSKVKEVSSTNKENPSNLLKNNDEINSEDLQNALDEIDKLDFNFDSAKSKEEKVEALKEFWD